MRDDGTVELNVHAQPGAGRTQITGRHGDASRSGSPSRPSTVEPTPRSRRLLADAFGLPAKAVELVSGDKSRTKRFRLTVEDVDAFADRLDDLVASGGRGPGPGRPGQVASTARLNPAPGPFTIQHPFGGLRGSHAQAHPGA